nr:DUF4865 family protein [Streptomyces sp. NBC_00886]
MHAMQYGLTLPGDDDMDIIRGRAARIGHLPDDWDGLWGGAFQGLVSDFGRPEVLQWTGLAYEEGGAADSSAAVAVRRRRRIPEGVELAAVMADAVGETRRPAGEDGAMLAAAVVDQHGWELVHFSLWEHDTPKAEGDVFQVLHLSAPGRGGLPRGRQW